MKTILRRIELTTKYGTSGLYSLGKTVTSPVKMDYYVAQGVHVLFFYNWKDSTTINSKEATIEGDEKTKNYSRTKNYLSVNNYVIKTVW